MAEQASAVQQPRAKRKLTRLRRIVRGLAWCGAALVLLVVMMPALLSVLPTERIVESTANKVLRGKLEVSGLSVGWLSPLRVEKVALRETKQADAPAVFYLEDFSIEKGLLANIFAEDRLGRVRVGTIGVAATRGADGTINIVNALPEGGAEEKPAEPLELNVKKYLPVMELPLSSLDVAVDAIHVTYRDEAITTAPLTIKYDGTAAILWRGGAKPLNASAQGSVDVDGRSAPLLALAEVRDWTDGRTLDLTKSRTSLRVYPAANDREPALLEMTSSLEERGAADLAVTLRAEQLPALMALAPKALAMPAAKGSLSLQARLVPQGGEAVASLTLDSSEIALAGYRRDDGEWKFPAMTMKAEAALGAVTLARSRADLAIDAPFANLHASEKKNASGNYDARVSGTVDFGALTRLAEDLKVTPDVVPVVEASAEVAGSAVYTDEKPLGGELRVEWRGNYLEWASLPNSPQFQMLCDNTIDLRPTSFAMAVSAQPRDDGSLVVHATGGGALFSLEGSGTYRSREDASLTMSFSTDLEAISEYAATQARMPVEFTLAGFAQGALDAEVRGGELRENGRVSIEGLAFASPLLPTGEINDDPIINWGSRTRMEAPFATRGRVKVESNFGKLEGGGRYDPAEGHAVRADGTLLLDPLLALLPEGMMPPPETMTLGGAVTTRLRAAATSPSSYDVSAVVASGENFALGAMGDTLAVRSFNAGTSVTLALEPGGNMKADVTAISATLEDIATLKGSGVYTREGVVHSFDVHPSVQLDAEKFAAFVQPFLAARELGELAMAGSVSQEFSLKGSLETGEALVFRAPLEIVSTTSSEGIQSLFSNAATEASATAEGLSLNVAITAPSLDRVHVSVAPASMNGFLLGTPQAEVVLPPFSAVGEFDFFPATRVFEVVSAKIDAPGALAASMHGKSDLNKGEHSFVGEVEAPDISRFVVKMAGMATDSPPLLTGAMSGKFSASAKMNEPSADGALLPFVYTAEANVGLTNLAVNHGGYAATGLGGSLDFKSDPRETLLRSSLDLAKVTSAAQEKPLAQSIALRSALYYDRTGMALLRNFEIESKDTGTNFYFRGRLEDVPALIASLPEEKTAQTLADWFMSAPFDVYTGVRQDMKRLPVAPDVMDVGGGTADVAFHLRSDPQRGIEAEFTEATENLTLAMPGLVSVENLNGTLPVTRALAVGAGEPLALAAQQGRFGVDRISITHPRLTGMMQNTVVTMDTAAKRPTASLLCENFFGGPATATVSMSAEGGDPVLAMDFTATGLDGAAYMPGLAKRPLASRSANCYGSLRLVLAEGQQVNGLLDRMLLRLEFTNVGAEILRETLRAMDAGGANPGIQATLASLRFSRPIRLAVEVRGGLLNLSIDMTTPAGVIYTIPVFERTNVASLLEGRIDPAMGENLELLRKAALLILAQRVDDVVAMVGTKGETP